MPTPSTPTKITLPRIGKVTLENFDLYSNQQNPVVMIEKPVFCLMGANGLGKSTFLTALNFAITGAIPDPARKFHSADDYYTNASRVDRAEDYFGGRISDEARPIARASASLSWPSATIHVTRDLFGSAVSHLDLISNETGEIETFSPLMHTDAEIRAIYMDKVLELSHLETFSQFVFLMHFVLTFDEARHLLMWDDDALTNALYLAFQADPSEARAADKLQREMDRESSRGRNVRFSARHVADRIKQLSDLLKDSDTDGDLTLKELKIEHEALLSRQREAEDRVRRKHAELRDADLKWTDLSAALTESQLNYRRLFSDRLKKASAVEHHPVIRASISEDICAICGTPHAGAKIAAHIAAGECPLCASPISASQEDKSAITELRHLDENIIRIRDELASILKTRERISSELAAAHASEEAATDALRGFEEKQSTALLRASKGSDFSAIKKEIEKLERERKAFLDQSEEHYKNRDKIRAQLRSYERKLRAQYDAGAEQFVPRFRELAEAFIGLPIDVTLEHRQGANDAGFGLALRMGDQLRSVPETVSESQRFFIDIALRMAIAEYMSDGPATLLIDTPEGSLDIAYEARAGSMFSKFVAEGHSIIMTANLRSSELVLRLAHLQRSAGMQIVRMTDWTDLSEVQQSEEALFENAYHSIEAALA